MNYITAILLFLNVSCFAQDSIPIYGGRNLIAKEIDCCIGNQNQLKCIDSLIDVTLKAPNLSGKIDPRKAYLDRLRKLGHYHFNAGIISGLRGNLDQSFAYFDKMESYIDSLNQNKKGNELIELKSMTQFQKTKFCTKTYYIDTAMFNRCNCKQFFTEFKDETIKVISGPTYLNKPEIKYSNWGEFYINDTLRINNQFVSDSTSIVYFKKLLRLQILTKLLQNPYYFEMLGDPSINLIRDTVIYKLSSKYEKGKCERSCELVFTSSQHLKRFEHFMLLISNIEFPVFIKDLEIYIPIVVTTESSINVNKANIYDDHFLIEVTKIKPIQPH